jgi:hypothetical protein
MQILYASPFLLVAAICFFVCAVISRLRKHALVVPVGVLSFGAGSIIAYFIFALSTYKLGYHGPANWLYLIPYIGGGLAIAIISSTVYRMIVSIVPGWVISLGLVAATFASSLVLIPVCSWTIPIRLFALDRLHTGQLAILGLIWLLIAFVISWRILRISEEFRPDPCLTWVVTRMFPHPDVSQSNEPTEEGPNTPCAKP